MRYLPPSQRARRAVNALLLTNLITIVVVIVLIITLTVVLSRQKDNTPELAVDGKLVQAYAAEYNVDTEYLQLILPGYLVYSDGEEYVFQKLDKDIPAHNYDIRNLSLEENGRIAYIDEDYPHPATGIDVSVYQQEIDWQAVAADGIDFAMIRVAYRGYESGRLVTDEYAEKNLKGATAAGLDVGIYVFSQAVTVEEAKEEAKLALELIQGYDISYPVALDMEEIHDETSRIDLLSIEERTEIAETFCHAVKKAGYTPMIYGNIRWLAGRVDLERLDYDVWFAQYYDHFTYPYQFTIWQYSDNGSVAGIAGPVDLNLCFTDYAKEK